MVVIVNTTGLIGFSTEFLCLNFSAGPRRFFNFFVMRKQHCHLNTGLYILPTENIGKQQWPQ